MNDPERLIETARWLRYAHEDLQAALPLDAINKESIHPAPPARQRS